MRRPSGFDPQRSLVRCTLLPWLGLCGLASVLLACGGGDAGAPDAQDACATPCPDGEVCRFQTCLPPPPPCVDGGCDGDRYCETGRDECLPWGVGPGGASDPTCTREAVPGVFFPGAQCEWLGPAAGDGFPEHRNVLGTPMVATFGSTSGEFGSPSLVFVSYNYTDGGGESCVGTDARYFGVLRVIDGRTCEGITSFPDPLIASQSVAIADLGGPDGIPEIVAARQDGGLIAFTREPSGTWRVLWRSADRYADAQCNWGGPSIHDLDDDGVPEIVFLGAVYSARGELLNTPLPVAALDVDGPGLGTIPVVADVDNDGAPELVTGGALYRWDVASTEWVADGAALGGVNGRIAVADLGTFGASPAQDDRATLDGVAEIVSVSAGVVHGYTSTGRRILQVMLPGTGNGGPPTIADFDGDGRAEIASAGGTAYTVVDPDCIAGATAATCPSGRTDRVLWTRPSQDSTSNVTGSSVFDFDGDGRAEAVYGDECFTRVYDGRTGDVSYSRYRRSCTWFENPVIADVDADFNAEIVVTSNTNCPSITCPALDPIFDGVKCLDDADCPMGSACGREQVGDALGRCRCTGDAACGGDGFVCADPIAGPSPAGKVCRAANPGSNSAFGVRVLADRVDRWVNTRSIWNQHAYSVTNIDDAGQVPRTSLWRRNWAEPGLNNFRQNVPGTGLVAGASPDLTVRTAVATCTSAGARLDAEVCNRGTEPVARGLAVAFYAGSPAGELACTDVTTETLAPGACARVDCEWATPGPTVTVIVDDDGTGRGRGANLECREANNQLVLRDLACP